MVTTKVEKNEVDFLSEEEIRYLLSLNGDGKYEKENIVDKAKNAVNKIKKVFKRKEDFFIDFDLTDDELPFD
jgi:hypothetical protein